eukprot:941204-Prymnesium_polylepis.1
MALLLQPVSYGTRATNQEGGAHRLASAVRMRLPSACSAPLKRTQSGAAPAHPALESPLCARDAT